jgi:hypothetical protein
VFCAALVGAGLGFLWFNTYPAQVFMGDIGALALGAALGAVAVAVRQEIVFFVMAGVFVLETVSVILQVASFKLTGPAHLPHGADSSPLRTQGLGRAEGHRALLDHHRDPRAVRPGDAEGQMNAQRETDDTGSSAGGPPVLLIGLGATGVSCARYFMRLGQPVRVLDSRAEPPGLARLGALREALDLRLGRFDASALDGVAEVVVSPGVSLEEPVLVEARRRGLALVGDIELFARVAPAPIAAVTGSNGKSTVTTLLAQLASAGGLKVRAGGNLGTPALDLLEGEVPDVYVLELSSFQLETTDSLRPRAACVLNITPDHIDRHGSLERYAAAKARILSGARLAVLNRDDRRVMAMWDGRTPCIRFGLDAPAAGDYGLVEGIAGPMLARGDRPCCRPRG